MLVKADARESPPAVVAKAGALRSRVTQAGPREVPVSKAPEQAELLEPRVTAERPARLALRH